VLRAWEVRVFVLEVMLSECKNEYYTASLISIAQSYAKKK
jgi:hypothetical protein